jgi:hypothetical protein
VVGGQSKISPTDAFGKGTASPVPHRAQKMRAYSLLKTLPLGGAAVYRCGKAFVLTWASAPEVRAADFFSRLFSP